MDVSNKRRFNYSDNNAALNTSVEIALLPALAGAGGWWLDRRFGTSPWCMLAIGALVLFGVLMKMYYNYRYEMDQHQANLAERIRPSKRTKTGVATTSAAPEASKTPAAVEVSAKSVGAASHIDPADSRQEAAKSLSEEWL